MRHRAKVVTGACTAAGLDPTGAVSHGEITIVGPVLDIHVLKVPARNKTSWNGLDIYIYRDSRKDLYKL
jgi:hypothetical protein